MAMTLLRGGPNDGDIVQTSRGQFGLGFVVEKWKKLKSGAEKFLGAEEAYYEWTSERVKHTAKKKGTVRVYVFKHKKPVINPIFKTKRPTIKSTV